ncbi:TPA: HAD family hydrolase [Neisseria meningitidis]|uniref:HAD family hydrolase n=1 Tax=Neisseria meningitidis TaxID=487 RepID=UPI0002686ED0|nr:HAD family hydrolase [Neisseria meningitidis]EJU77400.1 phosphoglycolate phosphatase [Neisseria meningitidis NM2795]RPC11065.1 phosphoglycolate phosphatase [Neisseria meningitidis]CCI72256.1 phosphoglycolate phosphatase [Neisseria meningitidis alpha704]
MIHAVLFDLDGTLADTALDLGGALNTLLARHGLPAKSMDEIRTQASHGAAGLIKLGAGITPDHPDYARWRTEYLEEYDRRYAQDTTLFDGVNELIAELDRRGIKWGIITNKPMRFTDKLVPKLGFIIPPAVVVSGDTFGEPKPSIKPMLYACRQIHADPQHTLYVGDAERDIQAGRNAGMTTVLAEWGYISDEDDTDSWQPDYRIATPIELIGCLNKKQV